MPPRTRSRGPNKGSVYLYIPNLIGYLRVILLLLAIKCAFVCWTTFLVSYSLSAILDLFDGMAARKFGQESKFGALLDMVTDRVGTNMLYIVLAVMYSEYYFGFALLAGLDYASHWAQMYAAALGNSHHKTISTDRNWLLRMYYEKKPLMFACCVCQEAFLLAIFAHFHADTNFFYYVAVASAPIGGLKQVINLIQLADASDQVVQKQYI